MGTHGHGSTTRGLVDLFYPWVPVGFISHYFFVVTNVETDDNGAAKRGGRKGR